MPDLALSCVSVISDFLCFMGEYFSTLYSDFLDLYEVPSDV